MALAGNREIFGGLRFYLNGAFLNEISAQQRANFCSTLAIGGFAGTHAAGSTERTFSGLVDEVRLQYIPDDEITLWTGTSIAVPDAPYSKPQTVGEWGKFNKSNLVLKSDLPSPKEDIVFTSTSLSNSKLIVENATVGTFAILDNSNSLVIPNMKQVDTSVEIDFTGWTVTGNWTIKFVSNTIVSGGSGGGGGGVTKDEALSIAIEAAIIFG